MQQEIVMPDQPISAPSSNSEELQAEDILDILNDDNEEKITEEKGEEGEVKREAGKSKDDEEDDEDDDEEENKDEDDEEDEDEQYKFELEEDKKPLMEPASRKKILAKYPNLFKEFPWLEHAHYRNNEYSQIFPTVDEAREAAERSNQLTNLENAILDGDTKYLLKAVKDGNEEAFNKLIDNYLTNLGQVDKEAYYHVIGNVTKSTIQAMMKVAERDQNKALKAAASILNQFIFSTTEITPPTRLSKEEDSGESNKLKKEREDFVREQFNTVSEELYVETSNLIKANIEANIDPKGRMQPYVKKNAVKDAISAMEKVINSDRGFKTGLNRLWERALQDKFSKNSRDSIKRAYLHRAKAILPEVIKNARREALRGTGHRIEKDRKGPLGIGRSSSSTNRGKDSSSGKKVPEGMSTLDFFNMD